MIISSISSELAGYQGDQEWYRPDFSIDVRTVPTFSLIDVLDGAVSETQLRNRDAVIAYTDIFSNDFKQLPLGESIPGAYFHVIGAQTIKKGLPHDFGWIPLWIISIIILAALAVRKRFNRTIAGGVLSGVIISPVLLDLIGISVEVFPAILVLGLGLPIISLRIKRVFDSDTGLLRLRALQFSSIDKDADVFALKVRNFSSIAATLSHTQMRELLSHVVHRIGAAGNVGECLATCDPSSSHRTLSALGVETLGTLARPCGSCSEQQSTGSGRCQPGAYFRPAGDR